MQQEQIQQQSEQQIVQVIQQSKIVNYWHFSFFFTLIVFNIYMMHTGEDYNIYQYGSINIIFLFFYLIPPIVVGYRLNYCLETWKDNIHCFKSFITLIIYLHQNDELKIFRHIIYITPFIQVISGEYVNNLIIQQSGSIFSQIEVFKFFRIFYFAFAIFTSITMICHTYFFITKYDQYIGIKNQYQHYIYLQDKQECYTTVMATKECFLLLTLVYIVIKITYGIIFLIESRGLIYLSCLVMVFNSFNQFFGTFGLFGPYNKNDPNQILKVTQSNHFCFQNYWCLIESIVRSKKFESTIGCSMLLYFIQSIIALVMISEDYSDIFQTDFFSLKCYVVMDTYSTFAIMVIKTLIETYKSCNQLPDSYLIYEFPPILTEQDIERIISQRIDCCFCLGKVDQPTNIKQLGCNGKHVFHKECIDKWLKSHSQCPLCKSTINI